MNALMLLQPGQLSLQQTPVPQPAVGEILIRVKAATTCGTDLKAFRRGHPQIPMPGPLGHEYSGDVVSVGANAPFAVGDAVMGVHSAPCQACYWCQRNQENLCETIMKTKVMGAFADYLLIPARIGRINVFKKPKSLSYEIASLLEPLACVVQGVQLLALRDDSSVLIIGPGAIGLMFAAALKAEGISDVTVAGRNTARLAIASKFGAQTLEFEKMLVPINTRYDIVIECTGQVEVWERSVDFVRKGGSLMLFGGPPGGTRASFDTHRLHYDQISIISPFHFGTPAVMQAKDWLQSANLDLTPLITSRRPLSEAIQVFDELGRGEGIKVVFQP